MQLEVSPIMSLPFTSISSIFVVFVAPQINGGILLLKLPNTFPLTGLMMLR